jgi:DNA-binding MarR family transcriptional regulator
VSALSTQELSLEVLGRFRVIFRSANKHFEAIEKSVGVSGAQLWALSEIVSAGELTVSQLARTMALHQSTTSNLIERLESRKLVLRVRSTEDRRVVNVLATAAGKIALAQAPGPFRGILPDALMRMDHEGLSALKSSLDKVLELLEHKSAQASMEPLGSPLNESE